MRNTTDFTIELLKEIDMYSDIADFIYEVGPEIGTIFNFDFRQVDFYSYASRHLFWVCRRKGKPVGVMMARLYSSIWDKNKKVLWQDLLFCKKSSGKAPLLLLETYIDFGRNNAEMVFTCKSNYTNIKEKSFERLGFKKSEELFLLEKRKNE